MKTRNAILVSVFLIFALFSLILFLTIPEARLESDVFWFSFALSIPVNFILFMSFGLWAFAKPGSKFAKLPVALYFSCAFTVALIVLGIIFMYLNLNDFTLPIILYAIVLVAYIISAIYSVIGTGYMASVEEKRFFIKGLEADVLDCSFKAAAPEVKAALNKFANDVRFSDPMGHSSLSGIESEINSIIIGISADLSANPNADVLAKLARADALLKSRNNRCIMLK